MTVNDLETQDFRVFDNETARMRLKMPEGHLKLVYDWLDYRVKHQAYDVLS